jgi:hypothetical protein
MSEHTIKSFYFNSNQSITITLTEGELVKENRNLTEIDHSKTKSAKFNYLSPETSPVFRSSSPFSRDPSCKFTNFVVNRKRYHSLPAISSYKKIDLQKLSKKFDEKKKIKVSRCNCEII